MGIYCEWPNLLNWKNLFRANAHSYFATARKANPGHKWLITFIDHMIESFADQLYMYNHTSRSMLWILIGGSEPKKKKKTFSFSTTP